MMHARVRGILASFVLAMLMGGCANERIPQNQSSIAAVPTPWPANFRDERPATEKKTSVTDNQVSTTIVFRDDVETNARNRLLQRILLAYPDMLATHHVVISKLEFMGIFRPELEGGYGGPATDPLGAVVAFGLLSMIEEKAVYLNVAGQIDGVEFVGWAHDRCKLCSAKGTMEKVMNQAMDKTMQSIEKALALPGKP